MNKVNKSKGMMLIISLLLRNKFIRKEDIINQLEINDVTFRRYMQEVRVYLANFNEPYELIYNRKNETYEIIENK